ncbi:MAG: phytanoyl-CoA dioxygenase family protein [Armatimonadetes bacterium]|nr:phytanoyl-CoA dioxygenase family protein [Armatimonadota bacterium]
MDDPLKGTALWTAVHSATKENGTMRFIPRVFREQFPHERDLFSNHHIRCYPDESKEVLVELPAGGILFFAYGTPHATGANNTDSERAGIAHHFINADQNGTALAGFEVGKRPFLTGADASGGEREYGVRLAGRWETEIERVLTR